MIVRALSITLVAMFTGSILASGAEAGERKRYRPGAERYVGPPEVFVGVPGFRLLFGDYALSREEYDALYGPDPESFDESYYEPEPIVPKPRKKPAPKVVKNTAPDATATAARPASPEATASLAPKNGSAANSTAMSCDKASGVVSEFGFSSVKAASCSGKLYAFNATRDGKAFSIKLDPATGELTEVRKLP